MGAVKTTRWIIIFGLLCGLRLSAQSIPISGQVLSQYGSPVAGAQVYICNAATSTGLPCTPTANIYQDYNLTTPVANPTITDANGDFNVYVGPVAFPNVYVVNAIANPGGTPYTWLYPGPSCPLSGCTATGPITATFFNATTFPYFEVNGTQLASTNLLDTANIAYLNAANIFTGGTQTFTTGIATPLITFATGVTCDWGQTEGDTLTCSAAADSASAINFQANGNVSFGSIGTGAAAVGFGIYNGASTGIVTIQNSGNGAINLTTASGKINLDTNAHGTTFGGNASFTGTTPNLLFATGGSVTITGATSGSYVKADGTGYGTPAAVIPFSGASVLPWTTSTTTSTAATSANVVSVLNTSPTTIFAAALLPKATSSAFGAVEPDNSTITVSGGVISSVAIPTAVQTASLISSDGTSGSRQFYQTANPDTTPPASDIYQNTTGHLLIVTVTADGGGNGFHGIVYCDSSSTPTTKTAALARVNDGSSNPNYYPGSTTFVVPNGYYYGISVTNATGTPVGVNALDSWTEWEL